VLNDIFAHEDMLPTLLAAAGVPDVNEQLLKGMKVGSKTFQGAYRRLQRRRHAGGQVAQPAARVLLLERRRPAVGLRYDQWKIVFAEQKAHGRRLAPAVHDAARAEDLQPPLRPVRDRRRGRHGSNRWWVEHVFLLVPAQQYVGKFIGTFREYPPSQKAGTFALDAVLQSLQTPGKND
jgi:arylsulfatase